MAGEVKISKMSNSNVVAELKERARTKLNNKEERDAAGQADGLLLEGRDAWRNLVDFSHKEIDSVDSAVHTLS